MSKLRADPSINRTTNKAALVGLPYVVWKIWSDI